MLYFPLLTRNWHSAPECEELSNTRFLPPFFCAGGAKRPAFVANSFPALPKSAYLQVSPPTPLASDIPSCPPKIGEGATSLLSMLLGGISKIRCRQTPSSVWASRYPFIPLAVPHQALTSCYACIAGRYPQSVAFAASPNFSTSYSGSPHIPVDCMGASQMSKMQETGDVVRVARTLHLLSQTLSSNDAQPGMIMALLGPHCSVGNRLITVLQCLLDAETRSLAEA